MITNLYVKSTSGSTVTLTGNVENQEVVVNAGGKVYNKEMSTVNTEVEVNAGGRAEIKASNKVKAKVRAGGSIYIYGSPKQVDQDKIFGGKIEIGFGMPFHIDLVRTKLGLESSLFGHVHHYGQHIVIFGNEPEIVFALIYL